MATQSRTPNTRLSSLATPDPPPIAANDPSPLLRLPFELRDQIWNYVFPQETIHLTRRRDGNLRAAVCPLEGQGSDWGYCCWANPSGMVAPPKRDTQGRTNTRMQDYCALIELCKAVHHEASCKFFASTLLALYLPENIIDLADTIRTPYLSELRSLSLAWALQTFRQRLPNTLPSSGPPPRDPMLTYDIACAAVPCIPGLDRFVLHFYDARSIQDDPCYPRWGRPLRHVRPLPQLDVVNWGPSLCLIRPRDLSVRLFLAKPRRNDVVHLLECTMTK